MNFIEVQWLHDEKSFKEALQKSLGCSGQQIKKYFNSKEQDRPVQAKDLSRIPIELVNNLSINPNFTGPMPKILAETDEYIVLHKPAGLHCHPLNYADENTVLNFLVKENKWASLEINKSAYDRGLLYRLDFETSGVLMLAKTQDSFEKMRKNFNLLMKRKIYWAIVDGNFNRDGDWTHYLEATGIKGSLQKASMDPRPFSHEAQLTVKKMMYENGKSLVMVSLKTGLRHQIRSQLSALGFPILGDELYGGKKADRLFLHAFKYESDFAFEDPNADLFDSCFDLNRALQVGHDMLRRL